MGAKVEVALCKIEVFFSIIRDTIAVDAVVSVGNEPDRAGD